MNSPITMKCVSKRIRSARYAPKLASTCSHTRECRRRFFHEMLEPFLWESYCFGFLNLQCFNISASGILTLFSFFLKRKANNLIEFLTHQKDQKTSASHHYFNLVVPLSPIRWSPDLSIFHLRLVRLYNLNVIHRFWTWRCLNRPIASD